MPKYPFKLRIWPHYEIEVAGQRRRISPQRGLVLSMMMADRISGRHMAEAADLLWPDPDYMPDFWQDHIRAVCSQVRDTLEQMGVDRHATYFFRKEK